MTRETLGLALDADLVRELDALAQARGVTRHEAARICLRLGIELAQRRLGPAQLEIVAKP